MTYILVFIIIVFIAGVLIVLKMLAATPQIDNLDEPQKSLVDVDTLLSQVNNNHVHPDGKHN